MGCSGPGSSATDFEGALFGVASKRGHGEMFVPNFATRNWFLESQTEANFFFFFFCGGGCPGWVIVPTYC